MKSRTEQKSLLASFGSVRRALRDPCMMLETTKTYFEQQAFGVCEWWANKLNIKTEQVRLSFIYLSFITVGGHLVAYLVMAFILKHKDRIKRPFARRSTVWEL